MVYTLQGRLLRDKDRFADALKLDQEALRIRVKSSGYRTRVEAMESIAYSLLPLGSLELAGRALGAAEAARERFHIPRPAIEEAARQKCEASVPSDCVEDWQAALQQGAALSISEASAQLLGSLEEAVPEMDRR